jgi:hypothetical protein
MASMSLSARIPVVAGLAYIERYRQLPPRFTATLSVEPDNRYFRCAIAVSCESGKVGYVAPEVAVQYYETVGTAAAPVTCPAQRGSRSDHETSGVELFLDLTGLPTSGTE